MRRPFRLALTGGIAMGKSTAARMFAKAGLPVFDADAAVHAAYEAEAVPPIEAAFPGTTRHGAVDRAALGRAVLGDERALARLEAIVHPLVAARREAFLKDAGGAGADIVLLDIPLLFETGLDAEADGIVVVTAPPRIQRARALARPGMTAKKLDAILARQMPDTARRIRADYLVHTDRGLDAARARVNEIVGDIRAGASGRNEV